MRAVGRRGLAIFAAAVAFTGSLALASSPARATAAQVFQLPVGGTFTVTGHGNGHGHGMSQYGAEGAALAGLTTAQILSFYYPGTSLTTLPSAPTIRVLISGGYANTCIQAKAGLTATGVSGALPATGSLQIAPSAGASGLVLSAFASARCSGTATQSWSEPSATTLDISSPSAGYVRLLRSDGTSTDYYGSLGAARNGSGELTINRVSLNLYAQGVAPREMPASWQLAAVQAQTIAARTYADYELTHAAAGSAYDICDNSDCQMYGGKARYDSTGTTLLWQDFPAGGANNQNEVLQYQGSAAFTQYSASDGGWTDDGGQPYLTAHADPYDDTASGDPYLTWTRTVSTAAVASAFGLSSVTSLGITARDGNGDMGGRVTAGYVYGTTASGSSTTVTATGFGLQDALGVPTNWFTLSAPSATANYSGYVSYAASILFGGTGSSGITASLTSTAVSQLNSGTALATVINQMATSTTALANELTELTLAVLHRKPAAKSIAAQVPEIQQGKYLSLEVGQFTTAEYFKKVGDNTSAFVKALFVNPLLLARNPSAAESLRWRTVLKQTKSRAAVVTGIIKTTEAESRQVILANQTVFDETPSASATAYWRGVYVKDGYSPTALLAAMLVHPLVLAKYAIPTS